MSLNISANVPAFSETQLHGLITGEYKKATTLTGWEAFKNFFIKLLNHLPGVSLFDKEKALKNFYDSIHPVTQDNKTCNPEKDITTIIATLKNITQFMSPDDVENITFHIDGVSFTDSRRKLTPTLNNGQNAPIYLRISINGELLPPILIKNDDTGLINISNIFSEQLAPASTSHSEHVFVFKNTPDENLNHNIEKTLSHIPTLIDDIIEKQDKKTLTSEECASHIIYLEELLNTPSATTSSTVDNLHKLIYTIKLKRDDISEFVDFSVRKKDWDVDTFIFHRATSLSMNTMLAFNAEPPPLPSPIPSNSEIKNNIEREITDFKDKMKESIRSFHEELNNKDINPLNIKGRLDEFNEKMQRLGPHLRGAYLSDEIKPEIDKLSILADELQLQNILSTDDENIYPTIDKHMDTLKNNFSTLMRNTRSAEMKIITADVESLDEMESLEDIESIHSTHHKDGESSNNHRDSGVSLSSRQNSFSDGSLAPSDEQDESRSVSRREIDIENAAIVGKKPRQKGKLAVLGSTIVNTIAQPFERIADVEARRTALQKPMRSYSPVE